MMRNAFVAALLAATTIGVRPLTRPPKVIRVQLVKDAKDRMYFSPSEISAHAGDTLRFVEVRGKHNVDFVADSNHSASNLPSVTALLEKPGETVDVVVRMAPGRYFFQCDPHAMLGMTGRLTVLGRR